MAAQTTEQALDSAKTSIEKVLADLPFDLRVVIEALPDQEIVGKALEQQVRVCKFDDGEERYVLGIVLEPQDPDYPLDSEGDVYDAKTIRQAAHRFMEEYRNIGLQHDEYINDKVKILETWIQLEDTTIGGQAVKAGSWLMAVRVLDDDLWTKVKSGDITGFSVGGRGKRTPIER